MLDNAHLQLNYTDPLQFIIVTKFNYDRVPSPIIKQTIQITTTINDENLQGRDQGIWITKIALLFIKKNKAYIKSNSQDNNNIF